MTDPAQNSDWPTADGDVVARDPKSVPAEPPPGIRYRHRVGLSSALREFWEARSIVRTIAERDILARHKQAILGHGWAILTPILMMLAFSTFFNRVAKVATGGIPYPLFSYLALVPWQFTSRALARGGSTLVANGVLLKRLAVPREVFPVGSILADAVDTIAASAVLALLFVVYSTAPSWLGLAWLPVLLAVQLAFTLGVTLLVSILVVYLRDITHLLPLFVQVGIFFTPVAYGLEAVPINLRLYAVLNPIGPVIDGYRQTVLYGVAPRLDLLVPAACSALALLVLGYYVFKRFEPGIADVS